jgi:hypothetical protein
MEVQNVIPLEQADPLKPGIYFVVAKSENLDDALNAAQTGLNGAQFDGADLKQMIVTHELKQSQFNNRPVMVHVVCAIIQVTADGRN